MRPVVAGGNSVTAVLAGAVALNQPVAEVSYIDQNTGVRRSKTSLLNSTTPVTLLTGTTPQEVAAISIFNADTATVVVTVAHVISAVSNTLAIITLAAGETLIIDSAGVRVIDNTGRAKQATTLTQPAPVNVTATSDGLTTGLIPVVQNGLSFVTVTSASANNIVSLPAAAIGDRIKMLVGTNGCKLISSVVADKCNNVLIGATNKAVLTAGNFYTVEYVAANLWLLTGLTNLGAVQTAIVPS